MIKKNKGIALIAAIMLIVFISTAVLGLSVFIVGWYKQIDTDEKEVRCIYNAQAGINYALYNYRVSAALTNGATAIDANNNFTLSTVSGGGGGGASGAVIINATASSLSGAKRTVGGWTIRNNSAAAITINQVTVTWQKTPKTLTSFVINNVTAWTGSIATPPAVLAVSITIPANTTRTTNNKIIFNSSAARDAGITLAFRMTDGTTTSPCTVYPAQASSCVQSAGSLTIKSMGKTTGSNQYRSVQATYNTTTGNVSDYDEIFQTVP